MTTVFQKLTAAHGEGENADVLNDLVAHLWPNINIAASKLIKDIADPMFKTMLPGPLASLHFTKLDLGTVPITFSKVEVVNTAADSIKLDLNVDWDGKCDISLDGSMIPTVGINSLELHGRLSVLLCPLTDVIPLIGAAQIAFINPPVLKLHFSGAADVADFSMINDSVLQVVLGIINSMACYPNRYLYKLDATADYFRIYHYPLGVIRLTMEKAWGFAEEAKGKASKLFSKLTGEAPDCYAKVQVGAEGPWKTTTKSNTTTPAWNETHDFVVTDFDQCITINVKDADIVTDAEVGLAVTTVKELLAASGKEELGFVKKGVETPGKISISGQFFKFVPEETSLSAADNKGEGKMSGLLTILVASAFGIKGAREELKPSVVVTWGSKLRFQTGIKSDYPGADINNPSFDQYFRVPVTTEMIASAQSLRIAIFDKKKETSGLDIPFSDLLKAPEMLLMKDFEMGSGEKVKASFCLRGFKESSLQEMSLPVREK